MGKRENKVERYLKKKIVERNGISRKWVSPGVDGVTDQICLIPMPVYKMMQKLDKLDPFATVADVYFGEVKTVDGRVSPVQEREHARLRSVGAQVRITSGAAEVDDLMDELKC